MVVEVLVLPGLPLPLVPPLLTLQTLLWPQPQRRWVHIFPTCILSVEKLLEVISDLQQPLLSATLSTTGPPASQSSVLCVRCLMIATEMLKELKLKKLPVNLRTMVDVLVSKYGIVWYGEYGTVVYYLYCPPCFCRCCPLLRVSCRTLKILSGPGLSPQHLPGQEPLPPLPGGQLCVRVFESVCVCLRGVCVFDMEVNCVCVCLRGVCVFDMEVNCVRVFERCMCVWYGGQLVCVCTVG